MEAGAFGGVYYPIVTLYQVVLAALILRGGRLDLVRGGVALVLLVNAGETYSYAAEPFGWALFPFGSIDLYRWDGLIVLTLPLVASQIPRPLGGPRGARLAFALWLAAVTVWILMWRSMDLGGPWRDLVGLLGSPGGLVAASAILALHSVPATVRLAPGPLRFQSMLLVAGLALGLANSGGYGLATAWERFTVWTAPSPFDLAAGGALVLVAYFAAATAVQAARKAEGARDALLLALGVGLMLPFGLAENITSTDTNEFIHQMVRPLLVGMALLRYDFVQVPRWLRQPLAGATAVLLVLAVFLLLAATFAGADVRTTPLVSPLPVALAAALVVVGAFALRGTVEEFLPVTAATDAAEAAARMERYRLALERSKQAPGSVDLQALRRELKVTAAQHQALAAVLERNVVIPSAALLGAQPGMVVAGKYQVERLLGQGGQGRALLAREVASGRQVVLKEALRPWETDGAERRVSLRREAAAARRVTSPYLARVEDVVEEAWQTYLVREYVPGPTLAEAVQQRGPLEEPEVAALAHGLLAGLDALHRAGLSCHDVKPGNVVLAEGGRAVLIDQGTARLADDADEAGATLGRAAGADPFTARWAAPEQLRGAPAGPRTDVYQAAALLAYAWTGKVAEPGMVPAGVPAAWRAALAKAMAREPERRPADAAALRAALGPVLGAPA